MDARVVCRENAPLSADVDPWFQAVFKRSPIACVVASVEGRILDVNAAFTRLLGYPAEAVRGRALTEITPDEDCWITRRSIDVMGSGAAPDMQFEKRFRHRDGHLVPADVTVSAAQIRGARHLIGQIRDRRQLVQARAEAADATRRLEIAANAAGAGSWELDVASGHMIWDETVKRHYDLSATDPAPTLVKWLGYVHEDDRAAIARVLKDSLRGGQEFEQDFRVVTGGGMRWIRAVGTIQRDEAGRAVRSIGLSFDVTALKASELQQRQRAQRLIAQSRAIGAVSASPHLGEGELDLFLPFLTEQAAAATDVARVNVWLFNDREDELHCVDHFDRARGRHERGKVLRQSEFIDEFAALKQAPYVDAHDALTDPRTRGYAEAYLKPLGITSMLDTVIAISGRHIGLLCLEHVGVQHHWDDDEIAFAGQLAAKVAQGIASRDRRRAEQALARSLATLQAQQEVSPDAILVVEASGRVASFNRQFADLWGINPRGTLEHWDRLLPDLVQRARDSIRFETRLLAQRHSPAALMGEEVELADGRILEMHSAPMRIESAAPAGRVWFWRDITDRKRAQEALAESERRLNEIANTIDEVFWISDPRSQCPLFVSPAYERIWGRTRESLYANPRSFLESIHREDRERVTRERAPHKPFAHEYRIVGADGQVRWLWDRGFPVFDASGKVMHYVGVAADITERRTIEQKLEQRERYYRSVLEAISDVVVIIDANRCVRYASSAIERSTGYRAEELIGMSMAAFMHPDDLPRAAERLGGMLANPGVPSRGEYRLRDKDGRWRDWEVVSRNLFADPAIAGILTVMRDVTEQRRMQRALADSEVRFRSLIEDASDAVAVVGADGTVTYISPAIERMGGYQADEIVGRRLECFVHPQDKEIAIRNLALLTQEPRGVRRGKERYRHKNGQWRVVETSARNLLGKAPIDGIVVTLRDVTERERHARALTAMSAANAALIHAKDEVGLLTQECSILTGVARYRLAWVGMAQDDERKSVVPVASAGEAREYPGRIAVESKEGEAGNGPVGDAIRTGQTQIVTQISTDPRMLPWVREAVASGLESVIALPLAQEGVIFGALALYAGEADAFDSSEIHLLEQLAADIAFGVATLRSRAQHARDLQRLEESMEATVHAIASTVEKRDPYTAGHERRVARLCTAIAREMALDEVRVRGLELAATVHDVGKIEVPSEILAKPGRLSEIEYALVKTHAQAGYEILKDVKFPWPIAQMVWQHHEKMDGSGYPRGLKGEEILLEARILSVADVVEAMSSHRPYRPTLGMTSALATIEKGRGVQFDAGVVDACLKLFREQRFSFGERQS